MSAPNEDGSPPALAADEMSNSLKATLEPIAPLSTDVAYPARTPPDKSDTIETSVVTPLPPNLLSEKPAATFDTPANQSFRPVKLVDIAIGDRLRGVVDEFTYTMVQSTSIHDVIQPPVVRPDPLNPGRFLLVSGLQRLNAAEMQGKGEILCRVVELSDLQAALWEIDENLVRAPLSPAEEAIFISRRQELHEQLHGKAKALGAAAANAAMGRNATANLADASFTADTAKKTGKSPRTVQRVIQRATRNGRENLARIAGTSLDTGAQLDALPLLAPDARDALIEQAVAGFEVSAVQASDTTNIPVVAAQTIKTSSPTGTSSAAGVLEAMPATSIDDRGLSALKLAWLGASGSVRAAFLAWIEEVEHRSEERE